jgi:hypothetical protein
LLPGEDTADVSDVHVEVDIGKIKPGHEVLL